MALDECEPNRWYCAFVTICHNPPGMGDGTEKNFYGIEVIICTYVEKNLIPVMPTSYYHTTSRLVIRSTSFSQPKFHGRNFGKTLAKTSSPLLGLEIYSTSSPAKTFPPKTYSLCR